MLKSFFFHLVVYKSSHRISQGKRGQHQQSVRGPDGGVCRTGSGHARQHSAPNQRGQF